VNAPPLIHAAVTMRTPCRVAALCANAAQLCIRVAQFVLLKTGAFCWRSFTPVDRQPVALLLLLSSASDAPAPLVGVDWRSTVDDRSDAERRQPISAACVLPAAIQRATALRRTAELEYVVIGKSQGAVGQQRSVSFLVND